MAVVTHTIRYKPGHCLPAEAGGQAAGAPPGWALLLAPCPAARLRSLVSLGLGLLCCLCSAGITTMLRLNLHNRTLCIGTLWESIGYRVSLGLLVGLGPPRFATLQRLNFDSRLCGTLWPTPLSVGPTCVEYVVLYRGRSVHNTICIGDLRRTCVGCKREDVAPSAPCWGWGLGLGRPHRQA